MAFAQMRLLEVGAGTIACVAVSLLSTLTVRRRWPGLTPAPAQADRLASGRGASRRAGGRQTLALLPVLHALFGIPELEQAGVTVMAVMIVPVADLTTSGLVPVSRRLLYRAIGCIERQRCSPPRSCWSRKGLPPVFDRGHLPGRRHRPPHREWRHAHHLFGAPVHARHPGDARARQLRPRRDPPRARTQREHPDRHGAARARAAAVAPG